MKKFMILVVGILLAVLVGCTDVSTTQTTLSTTTETSVTSGTTTIASTATTTQTTVLETTTEAITTTELTTMEPYDDRSLVPDMCDHLDNIDDWQPVWCDEFDYEGLPDNSRWFYDIGGGGWGNGELQYYTNQDLDNANVSEGTLKINLLKESFGGSEYTSARLTSKYRGDFLYGKIQIRAKLPEGLGTWAAAWMLPTDWVYGGWPLSGEIDIMEHVGYNPDEIHGTIHTAAYNHNAGTQIGYTKQVSDATTAFHVYELVWEPAYMEVFVDGVSYGRFGYNPLFNTDVENFEAWPFDQRFHIILNLAFGGSWGGAQGIDETLTEATMEVDYVRVYQKDYSGLDHEDPAPVEDLSILLQGRDYLRVFWDKAEDDVMVKEYEIYVDYVLNGTTTLNAYTIPDLMPSTVYVITVVAVDFAGNRSTAESLSLSTETIRTVSERIEAEIFDNKSGGIIVSALDEETSQAMGYINDDDYFEYVLLVEEAGTYTVTYRISSASSEGEIKIYGKSLLPLATTQLPVTGDAQIWVDVVSTTFNLNEGIYTFKIRATLGGFNLNYFEFKKVE